MQYEKVLLGWGFTTQECAPRYTLCVTKNRMHCALCTGRLFSRVVLSNQLYSSLFDETDEDDAGAFPLVCLWAAARLA